MLEALDRGNLFLVPLDDRRRWYRYQHLFADVLRAHVADERPDRVPGLHRRASDWYEENGERPEAIRHALAAGDVDRAADLLELAIPAMRRDRQEAAALAWMRALPDEVIAVRPVLAVHYAGALLLDGRLEGVEAHLVDAERWLEPAAGGPARPAATPAAPIVADDDEFRHLPSLIALYRAAQALAVGDVANTVDHARQALDLTTDADDLLRGSAAGLLGIAYWTSGDLEAAHRSYAACMASLHRAGHVSDVVGCALAIADIRITQGRLGEATGTLEQALRLASPQDLPGLRGTADMHVGLSELCLERSDLDGARAHLLASRESGEHAGLPQNAYRWRVAMARLRRAEGDLDGAVDLLGEADGLYMSDYFPRVRPIAALLARVWVAQGKLGEAAGWARAEGLTAGDELSYLREYEHITLARVLLARSIRDRADGSAREAEAFLDRLLRAAEDGERTGSVVEILGLLALAHQARGDIPAALGSLERALALAEPEGYVRIFVDEGAPMAVLLDAAAAHTASPGYVRRLRSALGAADARRAEKQPLVEPLSERELDVLRLLASDLDGPDIARELVLSLNTVRSHTKSIYAKLGVNSRREAVRRAAELGMLARSRAG
jgi:LuxR family maltose regulon positive regulatory protein